MLDATREVKCNHDAVPVGQRGKKRFALEKGLGTVEHEDCNRPTKLDLCRCHAHVKDMR